MSTKWFQPKCKVQAYFRFIPKNGQEGVDFKCPFEI